MALWRNFWAISQTHARDLKASYRRHIGMLSNQGLENAVPGHRDKDRPHGRPRRLEMDGCDQRQRERERSAADRETAIHVAKRYIDGRLGRRKPIASAS